MLILDLALIPLSITVIIPLWVFPVWDCFPILYHALSDMLLMFF